MLGLNELLDRMPRALSGGQRQRVAMGRAIVRRPALFLFDEPLSNLDAALRSQVRVDIRKLHDSLKTTSVYVTHDQVEAMTLADVMFVMNKGRVEQFGEPLDVYDLPATKFVAGFLGSPAMNFLPGEVGDGLVHVGDAGELPIDEADFDLAGRKRVTVGIRPHHMEPTDDGSMAMQVTLTEELGGETFAYGTVADHHVVVRLEPSTKVKRGGKLRLEAARVHLFDTDDGRSLRC